jgi:hypothetical protein
MAGFDPTTRTPTRMPARMFVHGIPELFARPRLQSHQTLLSGDHIQDVVHHERLSFAPPCGRVSYTQAWRKFVIFCELI